MHKLRLGGNKKEGAEGEKPEIASQKKGDRRRSPQIRKRIQEEGKKTLLKTHGGSDVHATNLISRSVSTSGEDESLEQKNAPPQVEVGWESIFPGELQTWRGSWKGEKT